jgi:hypothetical protein
VKAKIVLTEWFTQPSWPNCIGIVVIENEVGIRKAYIGTGDGDSESLDEQHIAELGGKAMPDQFRRIIAAIEAGKQEG